MDALASAVSGCHEREGVVVAVIVELHAITDARVVFVGIGEDSLHRASCNVDNVIHRSTAIGEPGVVANQEAEALLLVD